MKKLYPHESLSIYDFCDAGLSSNNQSKPEVILKNIMGLGYSDEIFGTESSSNLNDLMLLFNTKLQTTEKTIFQLKDIHSTTFRS